MNVGIYINTKKQNFVESFKTFYIALAERDAKIYVATSTDYTFDFTETVSVDTLCKVSDIVVTLGGDGTVLQTVPYIVKYDKAIMGINFGHVGFLTEFNKNSDYTAIADMIMNKKFFSEERIVLEIGYNGETVYALNEAVLGRGDSSKLVAVDVSIGEEKFDTYYADGVIIATATGSTAYSLASGGPIMAPDVDALIINGICPHSLHHRALVISGSESIKLTNKSSRAQLTADGNTIAVLDKNSIVTVKKAERAIRFLRFNTASFFERINSKLNRRG